MNENRLRLATEASSFPTDWSVIGARVIEAAELACAIHLQLDPDWQVPALEMDTLVQPEGTSK